MKLKEKINRQFGKPDGFLGKLAGWAMSVKNRDRAIWTIEKVKSKPSDHILEIGYGPGVTFKRIAGILTDGFIAGIDHSELMMKQASSRNKLFLKAGKAELMLGTVWDLNYPENSFDTIFGSNVHFFWENPASEFKKLISMIKPGGRLVMVFQPRWAKSEDQIKQIAEETKKQFEEAGFSSVETEFKQMKPVTCIYVGGNKP